MAGLLAHATSGEVSLSASTAKTVLQLLAATNHRVLLKSLAIMFKGVVVTDTPARIRLLRQTTAGTMSAVTEEKNDEGDDETVQTVATKDASAEPTAGNEVAVYEVHPQTGLMVFFPPGQELVIKGGNRLGLECLSVQGQTVVVTATWDE